MEKFSGKKEEKVKDFYQQLRQKVTSWAREGRLSERTGSWTDPFLQYLMMLPDMVHLLIKLLLDKEVSSRIKGYILIVFAYLLCPIDIIPDFLPVVGFIDDLLIIVVFLNKIINSKERSIIGKLKKYWAGEEDIFAKTKEIVAVMNELSAHIPKAIYNFIKKEK